MAQRLITAAAIGAACILPVAAQAAGIGALDIQPDGHGGQSYSVPIEILLLIAGLVFLPAALLTMTAFTSIVMRMQQSTVCGRRCKRDRQNR